MDVVYPVRRNEINEPLRYSLRSLRNLPDVGTVWFVGFKPKWVTGVEYIPGNRRLSKWLNVPDNLRLACEQIEAERLLIMNDDFFITEPVTEIPSWCRGTLAEHIATTTGPWNRSLQATDRVLREHGITKPLSYEIHIPVVMDRLKLLEVLQHVGLLSGTIPAQWRTVYGNWWNVPARQVPDVKLRQSDKAPLRPPFLSTDLGTFPRVLYHLQASFPEPSPYEVVRTVGEVAA